MKNAEKISRINQMTMAELIVRNDALSQTGGSQGLSGIRGNSNECASQCLRMRALAFANRACVPAGNANP
jgi:hypothetical protein